jgi:hypothetical protein
VPNVNKVFTQYKGIGKPVKLGAGTAVLCPYKKKSQGFADFADALASGERIIMARAGGAYLHTRLDRSWIDRQEVSAHDPPV